MRRLFPVLFLLLFLGCDSTGSAGQPSPQGAEEQPESREPGEGGEPLVIVARVLSAPRTPPCGASTYRVAVPYQVLEAPERAFDEEEILVRQDCPGSERPEGNAGPIVVGDVHTLTLDPEPYRTVRRVQWIPRRTDRGQDS